MDTIKDELVLQYYELSARVVKLESELSQDKNARLIKKLRIDKEGHYLLFIPSNIFSLAEAERFTMALKSLGFNCIVASMPKTDGIKVVEKT